MTSSTSLTTSQFSTLACPRGANECLGREWRAGRWPVALPLPRVRAVRRLRLHPGSRCTLLYSVKGWPEDACIAKVYARPHPSPTRTLAPLVAAGLTAPRRHRVPEVIAELPALRLVLMRVAPGRSVADLLRGGDLDATARAGEWLAVFHAAPLALPAAYTLHDPLAQADRWTRRIARHLPALIDRADALCARLCDECPSWPSELRLIHGDFGAAHVFGAADGATTVIDWDSCRVGDPAEDAGRFIASLWHLAARGHITAGAATAAARRFREAYTAAQPRTAARLPFYTAFACLRKAARLAQHGERQRYPAEVLLAAGLETLEDAG